MKWFNNLKMRSKILSVFILVQVFVVVLGFFMLGQLSVLNNNMAEMTTEWFPSLKVVNNMVKEIYQFRIWEVAHIMASSDADKNEYESRMANTKDKITKHIESWKPLVSTNEAKDMYDQVLKSWELYQKDDEKVINLSKFDKDVEAYDYMRNVARDNFNKIIENLNKNIALIEKGGADASTESKETYSSSRNIIYSMIIALVIIILIISIFLSSLISKIIVKLEKNALLVSEGDLKVRIDLDSKDELGNLAKAFNTMVTNFNGLIQRVMNQTIKINNESEALLNISNIAASAATELQAQSSTAASSSEQVSANVSAVATSTEEMTSSIKEISKNTTTASSLTRESEKRANEASTVMNRLGQSSQEIGNIVKSITSIAEQTNLLALNATIEAARAGESGKGFAVVANEVKELAKESAKATEDITNKIKAIQDDSINAIDVIKSIIENSTRVNEVTSSIASAIEEQSVTTTEVNRNLSEATMGVNSFVEVISGISNAANDYSKQAASIKGTANSLKEMSVILEKGITDNFKF
jgi:methyl-accepting chemotaxis protein